MLPTCEGGPICRECAYITFISRVLFTKIHVRCFLTPLAHLFLLLKRKCKWDRFGVFDITFSGNVHSQLKPILVADWLKSVECEK